VFIIAVLNSRAGKTWSTGLKQSRKSRDAYEYYTFYQEEEDIRSVG
jgi:hypothetical protein